MDILQDYRTGKLLFENGKFNITRGLPESLRQRIDIRLKTQMGTWFLNIYYGIDWFGEVFVKGVNKRRVDNIIQNEILKENGVSKIIDFTSQINPQLRIYNCTFKVKCAETGYVTEKITILANSDGFMIVDNNNIGLGV